MKREPAAPIGNFLLFYPSCNCTRARCLFTAACLCVAVPKTTVATMLVNFTPTPSGGIHLDLKFQGLAQPDPIQSRWIELILPEGTIMGGGSARSDSHFNDTLISNITANGQEVVPLYVRLGNDISFEQFFIFLEPGITTGQAVDMHIIATWNASDLPYSALKTGTYTASRPRFGNAIITIASVPEPSPATFLLFALGLRSGTRSSVCRDRTKRSN